MTAPTLTRLPSPRTGDADAVLLLLAAYGVPARRIHSRSGGAVQVRGDRQTRTSAAAVRILKSVGALGEMGSAVEDDGQREWSARTPDGTWVYVPCRPLTPFTEATTTGRGAADTESENPR